MLLARPAQSLAEVGLAQQGQGSIGALFRRGDQVPRLAILNLEGDAPTSPPMNGRAFQSASETVS
ncbi:MAG: hypothetical protein M3Q43_07135, partial [Actinomycetota bacterium]|nr:hypothetical protein [Actinomycetota bacterium]